VALFWKMTCSLRHPINLRHPDLMTVELTLENLDVLQRILTCCRESWRVAENLDVLQRMCASPSTNVTVLLTDDYEILTHGCRADFGDSEFCRICSTPSTNAMAPLITTRFVRTWISPRSRLIWCTYIHIYIHIYIYIYIYICVCVCT